jgi:hypothetical protein
MSRQHQSRAYADNCKDTAPVQMQPAAAIAALEPLDRDLEGIVTRARRSLRTQTANLAMLHQRRHPKVMRLLNQLAQLEQLVRGEGV